MEFSAKQIADFLHGEVVGNPDVKVSNLSKIEEGTPGTLTFLANPKYNHYIYSTEASIVLVNKDFVPENEVKTTLVKVENAYNSLALLLNLVEQAKPKKIGVSTMASIAATATLGEDLYVGDFTVIGENAKIGNNCKIYPQVYIGDNVIIKDNVTLYSGVRIYEGCVIGNNCILHSGAVVGSDGFGFAPSEAGYSKIPQIGIVTVEDDVEIGANTTIDRGTMGSTIIKRGVKIDNLVQIAHNVVVGENTVMAAQTGIAGSVKIGQWCVFAGQVGCAGHLNIGDKCTFAAKTGITNHVATGATYMGPIGYDAKQYSRSHVVFKKLPDLYKTINQLEKEIDELKKCITK